MKKLYKRVQNDKEERLEGWDSDFDVLGKRVKDVTNTFKEIIKKMKKPPFSLKQEIEANNSDPLLINVLKQVNLALEYVAEENKTQQAKIEQDVGSVLQGLHTKYSDIQSERKKLVQQCNEMRNLQEQRNALYVSLNNGANCTSGLPGIGDTDPASVKARELQSHIDDLEMRYTTAREAYLAKIHNFSANDKERADVFVTYLTLQRDYYHTVASKMDGYLYDLQNTIAQQQFIPVYHQSLQQHLQASGRKISFIIETCVEALLSTHAMQQQGLFRISPGKTKGEYLISRLQLMPSNVKFVQDMDPHSITYALKYYLRHLPDTLLGHQVAMTQWQTVEEADTPEKRLQLVTQLVQKLSQETRSNLAYLCHFLHCVTEFSGQNQMDAGNLSIVFAPNIFPSEFPVTSSWQMEILKTMIQFPSQIFTDPIPDCIKHFQAEVKRAMLEESSRDESFTTATYSPGSSNASTLNSDIHEEPTSDSHPATRHRRNLSFDLLGGSSSPGHSLQVNGSNQQGTQLKPSCSIGPGTPRPAPSRPPVGPTSTPRPVFKKAPPPPPILAMSTTGATPVESTSPMDASQPATIPENSSVVPTPMPRKLTQNPSFCGPSDTVPAPRPREGSLTGADSNVKPPRPNVPPPTAAKPKLATTSETSRF